MVLFLPTCLSLQISGSAPRPGVTGTISREWMAASGSVACTNRVEVAHLSIGLTNRHV